MTIAAIVLGLLVVVAVAFVFIRRRVKEARDYAIVLKRLAEVQGMPSPDELHRSPDPPNRALRRKLHRAQRRTARRARP